MVAPARLNAIPAPTAAKTPPERQAEGERRNLALNAHESERERDHEQSGEEKRQAEEREKTASAPKYQQIGISLIDVRHGLRPLSSVRGSRERIGIALVSSAFGGGRLIGFAGGRETGRLDSPTIRAFDIHIVSIR